jgi:hypothetical protein
MVAMRHKSRSRRLGLARKEGLRLVKPLGRQGCAARAH